MKLPSWLAGRIGDWIFASLGAVLVLASLIFAFAYHQVGATPERADDVAEFVVTFGKTIESVPLAGSREEAIAAMEALYPPFVSRSLLDVWEADVSKAPGRTTSNPRTVGIRTASVQNVGIGTYVVKAYLVQETKTATTTERDDGQAVVFGVIRLGNSWQIVEYQKRTP